MRIQALVRGREGRRTASAVSLLLAADKEDASRLAAIAQAVEDELAATERAAAMVAAEKLRRAAAAEAAAEAQRAKQEQEDEALALQELWKDAFAPPLPIDVPSPRVDVPKPWRGKFADPLFESTVSPPVYTPRSSAGGRFSRFSPRPPGELLSGRHSNSPSPRFRKSTRASEADVSQRGDGGGSQEKGTLTVEA